MGSIIPLKIKFIMMKFHNSLYLTNHARSILNIFSYFFYFLISKSINRHSF